MSHSTHFINGYIVSETYGKDIPIGGNLLLPLNGLFLISSKDSFYMHHLTDRIASNYTSCGALAGTRNSSVGPPCGKNRITNRLMSRHYTAELHNTRRRVIRK